MVIASESWQLLLMCLQVLACGVSVLTCRWGVSKTCYRCWNVILLSAVFLEWRFLMWRCIRAWWWSSVSGFCILSSLQTGSYFTVFKKDVQRNAVGVYCLRISVDVFFVVCAEGILSTRCKIMLSYDFKNVNGDARILTLNFGYHRWAYSLSL